MTSIVGESLGGKADPGIESALECRIETASEYQLGQPISIKGTLHNSSPTPIWVLRWNTFLDSDWQDCVSITKDGVAVPYVGVSVLRGAPGPESYARVAGGESLSNQIDISQKYDITQPGNYEASFSLPIVGAADEGDAAPPRDERALQLVVVESAKVSFHVGGAALDRVEVPGAALHAFEARLASAFPNRPMDPVFRGMDQAEMAKIGIAHQTAYQNILVALGSVQTTIETEFYNDWFETRWPWGRKSGWEKRREIVIAKLTAMATFMSSRQLTYAKQDPRNLCGGVNGLLAYTFLNSGGPVYFCPLGLNDEFIYGIPFYGTRSLPWDYAFMVVHEISHATAGTGDDWYSWFMCGQLANFNPDLAVANAQNYALFVMRRVGSDLPMARTYAVRCFNQRNGKFLGWLESDGNWLSLNGDDPARPPDSGYVRVRWYEGQYLNRTDSSRYIGDNGNGSGGNTRAAWNLWARASGVAWTEPDGEIFMKSNPDQRLGLEVDLSKEVRWISTSAPPPSTRLRFAFQEV